MFENKLTRRLSLRLVADARVMTLRAAPRRHGLSWHLINGVVKAWSAALTFLMQQGRRWCKGVKVVVTGGSKAYKSAVDAHLGHARHVLDRFHVIRWFSAGLTAVRRDIPRREPHGVTPAFDPEVFRARFALLRRGDTQGRAIAQQFIRVCAIQH